MSEERKLVYITIFLSVVIYAVIIMQNIYFLDRIFLPDDTYYTLTITRNIAHGCGPSMLCGELTSGFQPLISLFFLPVFFITNDLFFPIYYAIFISIIFGIFTNVVFAKFFIYLSKDFISSIIFIIFLVIFKNNIYNYFNGLETSLACFFAILALFCTFRIADKNCTKSFNFIVLGTIVGLSILARIDSILMVFFLGLFLIYKFGFKNTALVVITSFITVFPVWLYNYINFSSVIPESGAAVRNIVLFNKVNLTKFTNNIYINLAVKNYNFLYFDFFCNISFALFLIAFLFLILKSKFKDYYLLMFFIFLAYFIFYICYLPAFWFFSRYLCLTVLISQFILFSFLSNIKNKVVGRIIMIFLVFINSIGLLIYVSKPESSILSGIDGAKGYAEIAQDINTFVPNNEKLAAMQSGALTYFSNGREVYNLDGVVNNEALQYLKLKKMNEYLLKNQINYFVDWKVNVNFLLKNCAQNSIRLEKVKSFKKQGTDQFTLYRIIYQ